METMFTFTHTSTVKFALNQEAIIGYFSMCEYRETLLLLSLATLPSDAANAFTQFSSLVEAFGHAPQSHRFHTVA